MSWRQFSPLSPQVSVGAKTRHEWAVAEKLLPRRNCGARTRGCRVHTRVNASGNFPDANELAATGHQRRSWYAVIVPDGPGDGARPGHCSKDRSSKTSSAWPSALVDEMDADAVDLRELAGIRSASIPAARL
jgi:hypothetical protein